MPDWRVLPLPAPPKLQFRGLIMAVVPCGQTVTAPLRHGASRRWTFTAARPTAASFSTCGNGIDTVLTVAGQTCQDVPPAFDAPPAFTNALLPCYPHPILHRFRTRGWTLDVEHNSGHNRSSSPCCILALHDVHVMAKCVSRAHPQQPASSYYGPPGGERSARVYRPGGRLWGQNCFPPLLARSGWEAPWMLRVNVTLATLSPVSSARPQM